MKPDELSFEDLLNESEAKDFFFKVEREMLPKMKASALCISIGSEHPDVKLALAIGAAILFEKPLIVAIPKGVSVPAGLRRVADRVIEIDFANPREAADKMQEAISDLIGQGGRPPAAAGKQGN
jgi:hypothetical protein